MKISYEDLMWILSAAKSETNHLIEIFTKNPTILNDEIARDVYLKKQAFLNELEYEVQTAFNDDKNLTLVIE